MNALPAVSTLTPKTNEEEQSEPFDEMLARDVGLPETDALATARQRVQDPRAALGDHHCKPPKREACGALGDRPSNPQATSDQLPDEDVDEVLAERPGHAGPR